MVNIQDEIKHLNYFTGQFLVERDFKDEQGYHIQMRYLHNQAMHSVPGVAVGLDVSRDANRQVRITRGIAVDRDGREVTLPSDTTYTLEEVETNQSVFVTLGLLNQETDPSTSGGFSDKNTRIHETALFKTTPTPNTDDIVLARIELDDSGNIREGGVNSAPPERKAISARLAPNAVTTNAIANGAVTRDKLAPAVQTVIDAAFPRSGGTLSGELTLGSTLKFQGGNPIQQFSADGNLGGNAASDAVLPTQRAVKAYVDARASQPSIPAGAVNKAGDTMSGALFIQPASEVNGFLSLGVPVAQLQRFSPAPGGTERVAAPLSIRGAGQAENVLAFTNRDGATQWHINQIFGGNTPGLNIVETGVADGRIFISKGTGRVGINRTDPGFTLDVNGPIRGTNLNPTSDIRLKTNIAPLTNVLEKLDQIHGISFEWDASYESLGLAPNHREIGVIAQEIETVFPELVMSWGEDQYKAVDYYRLPSILITAIQELKAENDKLKQRLEALEHQVQRDLSTP